MTTTVPTHGGPAVPVSSDTSGKTMGRVALRAYGFPSEADAIAAGFHSEAGPASSVYVVSAAELVSGKYVLEGDPKATPIYTAPAGMRVEGGYSQPVYLVGGSLSNVAPVATPWYRAGGAPMPVAAYQPKDAATLAESYIDLTGNGHTATPGAGTDPTLSAAGWSFSTGKYLDISVSGALKPITVILQHTPSSVSGTHIILQPTAAGFQLYQDTTKISIAKATSSVITSSPAGTLSNGVEVITGFTYDGSGNFIHYSGGSEILSGTNNVTFDASTLRINHPSFAYAGTIARIAIYDAVLTRDQMFAIATATGKPVANFVTVGDSITQGSVASDAAHRWANLVSANKVWRLYNNGIASTPMQNTVQNTAIVIGAAVQNNLRDTYQTRVLDPKPRHVCILYGLIDMLLNDPAFNVTDFQTDYEFVVDAIIAAGVPATDIVIGSVPYIKAAGYTSIPFYNAGSPAKHAAHIAACAAVAAAKGTKYVDVYAYMLAHGGDALMGDNIHPNDAGHAAIAAAFLSVL